MVGEGGREGEREEEEGGREGGREEGREGEGEGGRKNRQEVGRRISTVGCPLDVRWMLHVHSTLCAVTTSNVPGGG